MNNSIQPIEAGAQKKGQHRDQRPVARDCPECFALSHGTLPFAMCPLHRVAPQLLDALQKVIELTRDSNEKVCEVATTAVLQYYEVRP